MAVFHNNRMTRQATVAPRSLRATALKQGERRQAKEGHRLTVISVERSSMWRRVYTIV